MKKSSKQILLLVILLAVVAVVALIVWRLTLGSEEIVDYSTSKPVNVKLNSDLPPPPVVLTEEEIKNDENLSLAQAILSQFDKATDSRGFYGFGQDCNWNDEVIDNNAPGEPFTCQVQTMDYAETGEQFASHRYSPAIIWARYQYYEHTGDKDQLEKMLLDLENLVTNILDHPSWVLQNDVFNCFLMQDLVNSPYLDDTIKLKAKRVCNESPPEVHPESLWEYDQHHHLLYKLMDPPYQTTAIYDPDRIIPDDQRVTYSSDLLIEQINQLLLTSLQGNLSDYYDDGYDDYNNFYSLLVSSVPYADQHSFLTREAFAAIDQLSAFNINADDPILAEQNLIDYLLFTKETLIWYLNGAGKGEGRCLVEENLRHYVKNFALSPDLTLTSIQDIFFELEINNGLIGQPSPSCSLAAAVLNNLPLDRSSIIDTYMINLNLDNKRVPIGYASPDTQAEFSYPIYSNSMLAGILSKYFR